MRIVGVIGCGAIGTLISRAFNDGILQCDELVFFDNNRDKAVMLQQSLCVASRTVATFEDMLGLKPTVIVEAASQEAVAMFGQKILDAGIDLVVMSVGALLDLKLKNDRLHIPSGAIGGVDALKAAALAGIETVKLTSRKSPEALQTPGGVQTVVFEGNAREAVRRFPREMNVAATLALTVGGDKVKVKIIADPNVKRNVHEIGVIWKGGEMQSRFENDPHPDNPGTSALAAWSAISLLEEILKTLGA